MKVAIMQPYFLPYIGYFQLIGAADKFVIYDNIKYTKKGWINRNRYLLDGRDEMFSLPLKKDSDALDVRDRRLAADFDRAKLLNRLAEAYRRAPRYGEVMPLLQRIIECRDDNLFGFIHASLSAVCRYLGIDTPLIVSSTLEVDHSLQGQDRVLAICRRLGADTYINAIGGRELYSHDDFAAQGIELRFLQSLPSDYPQFGRPFVPWLSILDVMMFNTRESISRHRLRQCETTGRDP
ncbi:MAG: WbqC family protein [Proteobacteria bacterium]|nr:WbqC family protein [Pseudomonadota bacterium]